MCFALKNYNISMRRFKIDCRDDTEKFVDPINNKTIKNHMRN